MKTYNSAVDCNTELNLFKVNSSANIMNSKGCKKKSGSKGDRQPEISRDGEEDIKIECEKER